MTNPTKTEIQYDVGDARNVTGGTTAITSFITKAKSDIKDITGTTTGNDNAIRNLADMYTVNAMLGGLGPESVGRIELISQRNKFYEEANRNLLVKGFALDGKTIRFTSVNQ